VASLRQTSTGWLHHLEPEHFVGRALTSNLRLSRTYVSAQHARLRWMRQRWEVRDLGSRNGTFLDGARLEPRADQVVRQGAVLAFGTLDEQWEVVDDSSPPVMAVPLSGGDAAVMSADLLALPSQDEPLATIYRVTRAEGVGLSAWLLEDANHSIVALANRQVFQCGGRLWRFCCPEELETYRIPIVPEHQPSDLHLVFTVKGDQSVQVEMRVGDRRVELGTRAHHCLLLALAKRRLQDLEDGQAEAVCGWVDCEDLAADARMKPPQLNIDVFRIRRQFASAGLTNAARVIERRTTSRQLRIGVARLSIIRV
jgi:hypothetical protein